MQFIISWNDILIHIHICEWKILTILYFILFLVGFNCIISPHFHGIIWFGLASSPALLSSFFFCVCYWKTSFTSRENISIYIKQFKASHSSQYKQANLNYQNHLTNKTNLINSVSSLKTIQKVYWSSSVF